MKNYNIDGKIFKPILDYYPDNPKKFQDYCIDIKGQVYNLHLKKFEKIRINSKGEYCYFLNDIFLPIEKLLRIYWKYSKYRLINLITDYCEQEDYKGIKNSFLVDKNHRFYGERLRFLLALNSIKEIDIAKFLLINNETFTSYLHSRRRPNYAVLKRLCNYFGVNTEFFYETNIKLEMEFNDNILKIKQNDKFHN